VPSSLQYPLDRHRELQRKWSRLLDELSPKALSAPSSRSITPKINPQPLSVWLSAIERLYDDAFAAPIPPRLAELLKHPRLRHREIIGARQQPIPASLVKRLGGPSCDAQQLSCATWVPGAERACVRNGSSAEAVDSAWKRQRNT
jgi:hypothetical protein